MPPRTTYARNANAAPPFTDQEVSNVEFKYAIQMLTQSMTNQNNQVLARVNENGKSVEARDSQNLLDEIKKNFKVMQVTGNDRVELASYQLKDVALIWFFPIRLREAKAHEIMNLRRGKITVQEYGSSLTDSPGDMNISSLMTHAQQVECDKLKEQAKENKKARTRNYDYSKQKSDGENHLQSHQKFSAPTPLLASVPSSKNRFKEVITLGNSSGIGGSQCQNKLYALHARQDQEGSPDVVTGTLRVFDLDVFCIVRSMVYSFFCPHIAVQFSVSPKTLSEPFIVSTPVGDLVIGRWVYRNRPV
ncbi:uncharacterized protein [Solanum lycopersicum]|uniref:uncharacterized protein n=1 Tax=Solanum lycopersicum TaxID=4081 RepID=UPI0037490729